MGAGFGSLGSKINNGFGKVFGHLDPNATEGAVVDETGNAIADPLHGLSEAQKRNRMLVKFGGAGLQGYGQSQYGQAKEQQQSQPNPYGDFSQYWRQ